MTEFEIKLEVPAARARAVRAALARLHPASDRLRAIYFDTPERLLARERMVLRTRFENGRWMQTLKGEGGQAHERLEHNVPIRCSRGEPTPSAARHHGTPFGARLTRLLGEGFDDGSWEALFETDVERTTAWVDHEGSTIEIAFDRGRIVAGGREAPLCEIEFELKEGEPRAAVDLARRWCARHALAVSTISKAHKGMRLASGEPFGPAAPARESRFPRHASLARIAGEALASSLDQVVANASEVAAGSRDDEHVHQLRVGIRRARTALRELVGLEPGPEENALVHAFRELGRHRDLHHVLANIEPRIRAAGGAVPPQRRRTPAPDPVRVVHAAAFQDALLSLLALASELRADDTRSRKAAHEVGRRLDKLLAKTLKDGRGFESLDAARQHRVRKRIKRMRYLAEFTAALHRRHASEDFLALLRPVQDALGDYNDEVTALAHYRARAAAGADASFAIGWLEADRARLAADIERLLRKFGKVRPFWR